MSGGDVSRETLHERVPFPSKHGYSLPDEVPKPSAAGLCASEFPRGLPWIPLDTLSRQGDAAGGHGRSAPALGPGERSPADVATPRR